MTPTNNTTATTVSATGAATLVLVWTLGQLGIHMPPDVAGAAVFVAVALAAWLGKPRKGGDHAAR